ncbi:SpaH/EbpB family LPXTG-anchored major pilin [Xylanimonas sp. McL0601]|uniref:SpaH/EbpB family LPXTG-anchored major pilin n=1 Tax=Xylanimonas sp. McL0601 TaxID=3414739 RepID=UPI003CF2555C
MRGRIAVLVTAALALVATPLAASAAEAPPPSTITQPSGKLHITKLAQPATAGDEAPGTQLDTVTGVGIDGVTFEAQRLTDVDLTTAAGWRAAQDLTLEQALKANLGVPVEGETADGGKFTLTLPVGLYLVRETNTPADVVPAVPFLVTVPMTNPDNPTQWMYDVYVYPKSADSALTKTIKDGGAAVAGDTFTYDVMMELPEGTTKLVLTDTLDARLNFSESSLSVIGEPRSADGSFDSEADTVKVNFDEATRILTVEYSGDIVTSNQSLGFRIAASVTAPGVISNEASYIATVPGGTVSGDSDPVETKWGRIDVLKVNENDMPLRGATFRIALTEQDAKNGNFVDGEAVSGANGRLSFVVRYSDWWNGEGHTEGKRGYWLVETQAPDGFELQPAPIGPFYVTGAPDDAAEATVVNVTHNAGFELPAIGGNRAILPIIAAIVVGGGVIWLIRSRRANA